jgi:hypothetical protein
MENKLCKLLCAPLLAAAAVLIVGSAAARANGNEALWEAGLWWITDPIEGLWDVEVTVCGLPTFDALALFARGGTFHDTNSLDATTQSSGFGTWRRIRGRTYEFAFKTFLFGPGGTPATGSQIVRHTVTLARDGQSYTSEGFAEQFDAAGNLVFTSPPGCSSATATRVK